MNIYRKHLSQPWFDLIKDHSKTVEGRPNRGDFKKMKVNDQIEFFNQDSHFRVEITAIHHYDTFYDMIKSEGLQKVLPNVKDIDGGVAVYRQWYDQKVEDDFGVVAIMFLIKN